MTIVPVPLAHDVIPVAEDVPKVNSDRETDPACDVTLASVGRRTAVEMTGTSAERGPSLASCSVVDLGSLIDRAAVAAFSALIPPGEI